MKRAMLTHTTAPAVIRAAAMVVGTTSLSKGHMAYHNRLACSFPEACGRLFPGLDTCLGSVDTDAANDDSE